MLVARATAKFVRKMVVAGVRPTLELTGAEIRAQGEEIVQTVLEEERLLAKENGQELLDGGGLNTVLAKAVVEGLG